MPFILAVGNDASLTKTRAAVLTAALDASVVVADPSVALLLLQSPDLSQPQHFDLIVMCHTVSPHQVELLREAGRQQFPPAKMLLVDPLFSGSFSTTAKGERTGPSADPAILVDQALHLLGAVAKQTKWTSMAAKI
jgi:hypothetical protein